MYFRDSLTYNSNQGLLFKASHHEQSSKIAQLIICAPVIEPVSIHSKDQTDSTPADFTTQDTAFLSSNIKAPFDSICGLFDHLRAHPRLLRSSDSHASRAAPARPQHRHRRRRPRQHPPTRSLNFRLCDYSPDVARLAGVAFSNAVTEGWIDVRWLRRRWGRSGAKGRGMKP